MIDQGDLIQERYSINNRLFDEVVSSEIKAQSLGLKMIEVRVLVSAQLSIFPNFDIGSIYEQQANIRMIVHLFFDGELSI